MEKRPSSVYRVAEDRNKSNRKEEREEGSAIRASPLSVPLTKKRTNMPDVGLHFHVWFCGSVSHRQLTRPLRCYLADRQTSRQDRETQRQDTQAGKQDRQTETRRQDTDKQASRQDRQV